MVVVGVAAILGTAVGFVQWIEKGAQIFIHIFLVCLEEWSEGVLEWSKGARTSLRTLDINDTGLPTSDQRSVCFLWTGDRLTY